MSQSHHASILHVDDDPLFTRIVSKRLGSEGYVCHELNLVDRWCEVMTQGNYDVLLLDMEIPGTSGLEILKIVGNIFPDVSVVMLTGVVNLQMVLDFKKYGAEYCFFKPISDMKPLVNALRNIMQRRQHWRSAALHAAHSVLQLPFNPLRTAIAPSGHEMELNPYDSSVRNSLFNSPEDDFANQLILSGYVSAELVEEARSIKMQQCPKIGQLAMQMNLLSIRQVFDILRQQVNSNQRFGELAIRMGFIDDDQLTELLEIQKQATPALSDVLVAIGAMSFEDMNDKLQQFHDEQSILN